jgi:hypothetical protein
MAGLHPPVKGFADPGVHTGNAASKLLSADQRPGWVPVIEGKQVHPFRCAPPKLWLNLGYRPAAEEYFRIADDAIYRDTDILIRQTASRPVAARHTHRCHFRNSVLALKVPENLSVEYLLGILNSDTACLLYRTTAPETLQRSFPQIKVGALRQLPIPDPQVRRHKQLAGRIEKAVKVIEARAHQGLPTDRLVRDLNVLVRDIYGLSGPGG